MKTRTPGPWQWISGYCLYGPGGREVLTTARGLDMTGEPDAALIAAAPDMLAVLKQVSGAIAPGCEATRALVEAVIAKAEGGAK